MELKELKTLLEKGLKDYKKEREISNDNIAAIHNSYDSAVYQEIEFVRYVNDKIDLKKFLFISGKTGINLNHNNFKNYNHYYDKKNGDFFMYSFFNGNIAETVKFDLKVSTKEWKKYAGPISLSSWEEFKGYNNFYISLSYDGKIGYLIDTKLLTEKSFSDQNKDGSYSILGKTLEKLSKLKNSGVVKLKM